MTRRAGRAVLAHVQRAFVRLRLLMLRPGPVAAERRVLVRGYFGVGNLGDEVLLSVIVRLFLARGWRVTAMSFNPDRTRLEHGIEAVLRSSSPLGVLSVIPHLRRARICLLGPGGILQSYDRTSGSLFAYTLTGRAAKRLGLKVGLLGVGAGPLTTLGARHVVRSLLDLVDVALFRDEASRQLAAPGRGTAQNVLVAPDLVFLSEREEPSPASRPGVVYPLGFAPVRARNATPACRPSSADTYRAQVAAGLLAALPAGVTRIPGFVFHETEDAAELRDFAPHFAAAGVTLDGCAGPATLAGAQTWLDSCDVVVVSRFHALAMAILRGRPCVVLAYHPKVRDLALAAGLGAWTLTCNQVRAAAVTSCIRRAQAEGDEIRRREQAYRRRAAAELQEALDRLLPKLLEAEDAVDPCR